MSWELGIVAIMAAAIYTTAYMAFKLDAQHAIVKVLLFFLSYFSMLGLFDAGIIIIETTAGASTRYVSLLVGFMWVYGLMGVILVLYLGYYIMYGVGSKLKDKTEELLRMK